MRRYRFLVYAFIAIMLLAPLEASAQATTPYQEMTNRALYWKSQAYPCDATPKADFKHKILFPSSKFEPPLDPTKDPRGACNDNDMLLFMAQICAGGEIFGCQGVRESQDSNGRWHRNPQYRLQGFSDPGGGADFSPDMTLGVMLYALTMKDEPAFYKWLLWLDSINHPPPACTLELVPVLVPNDCRTFLPLGEAAMLSRTVSYFQTNYKMPKLPDGALKGELAIALSWFSEAGAISNFLTSPGYPMHLLAVMIQINRKLGMHDLDYAVNLFLVQQPENKGNAFFDYLSVGSTDVVVNDILASCPSSATDTHPAPNGASTWHWQNSNKDKDWVAVDYWDCMFAADLYNHRPAPHWPPAPHPPHHP